MLETEVTTATTAGCGERVCPLTAPAGGAALADTIRRFQHEAVRGECETGRYRCPYFVWGKGPPILLIPGFMDDASSFVLLADLLADSFRMIAYDLPTGQGDGARIRHYRHGDLVDDAFALLDHFGIEQSYVFGSSFGSTIALAALRKQPRRLPRAVLQGGFAQRRLAPAEVLLARLARFWPGPVGSVPFRTAVLRYIHGGPFRDRPREIWNYFVTRSNAAPIKAAAQRALLIHGVDLRSILPAIRQPVLLVCGDRDPLVDQKCEDVLQHGLPSAGRIELANCGHNPLFTHPEALAEIVRRFLTPPEA